MFLSLFSISKLIHLSCLLIYIFFFVHLLLISFFYNWHIIFACFFLYYIYICLIWHSSSAFVYNDKLFLGFIVLFSFFFVVLLVFCFQLLFWWTYDWSIHCKRQINHETEHKLTGITGIYHCNYGQLFPKFDFGREKKSVCTILTMCRVYNHGAMVNLCVCWFVGMCDV